MKFAYLRTGDHCSKRHITTMAPKTARREMSVAQKGIILVLRHLDYKITTISKITGRPWSTIKNFLIRAKTKGSLHNQPRSGRPPKLLREVKTWIALTKEDYSGWLFQLVYMYISPNLVAVLGPLAICMLIHFMFHHMSYPSCSFQGYATEYFPTPSLTPEHILATIAER